MTLEFSLEGTTCQAEKGSLWRELFEQNRDDCRRYSDLLTVRVPTVVLTHSHIYGSSPAFRTFKKSTPANSASACQCLGCGR